MQVKFTFNNGVVLFYNLNDTAPSNKWVHQLSDLSTNDLLHNSENYLHGFASPDEFAANIAQLKMYATKLGISLNTYSIDNLQSELNRFHTYFPEFVKVNSQNATAHKLNLLIHWLEYEIANLVYGKNEYLINIDFNHVKKTWNKVTNFDIADLANFSTNLSFGNIHLHYTHIGRHFLEMFNANDTICQPNQFVPMNRFTATCGLVFSEPSVHNKEAEMKAYYDARGGKNFFKYEFDNPRLAKGFFKIGELVDANEYTFEQRCALRNSLCTTTISKWEFM